MNKLVSIRPAGETALELCFSDGSEGVWSARELIVRDTILTRPLANPDYFALAFIAAGALAWPNGLELSAPGLHRRLDESNSRNARECGAIKHLFGPNIATIAECGA
jgi:hypothetical protein